VERYVNEVNFTCRSVRVVRVGSLFAICGYAALLAERLCLYDEALRRLAAMPPRLSLER
jgi:hypothetical protein